MIVIVHPNDKEYYFKIGLTMTEANKQCGTLNVIANGTGFRFYVKS